MTAPDRPDAEGGGAASWTALVPRLRESGDGAFAWLGNHDIRLKQAPPLGQGEPGRSNVLFRVGGSMIDTTMIDTTMIDTTMIDTTRIGIDPIQTIFHFHMRPL